MTGSLCAAALRLQYESRMFADRVQIYEEVFYYDYCGGFASAYNTALNSNQTFNAQKIEIDGNQLDAAFKPSAIDQTSVSNRLPSRRDERFSLSDSSMNYAGEQLRYAPNYTVNVGYFHDFPLPRGYLRAKITSHDENAFYADFSHTRGACQQPDIKSDASLTYFSSQGGCSIGGWVKNIQNVAATAGGSKIAPLTNGATAFLETPRTYGVRLTHGF